MSADPILDVCRQWIADALPELKDVIYLEHDETDAPFGQGLTRDELLPYAAIEFRSAIGLSGTPYEKTTNVPVGDNVETFIAQRRRRALHIEIYGDNCFGLCDSLRLKRRVPALAKFLRDNGISIGNPMSEIVEDNQERPTFWVRVAMVDLACYYVLNETTQTPWIATAEADLTFKNDGDPP